MVVANIKYCEDLLARDGRVESDEFVNRFAAFEEIDQALDGHTSAPEARGSAHASGIHPDSLIKPGFLFSGHNFTVSHNGVAVNFMTAESRTALPGLSCS